MRPVTRALLLPSYYNERKLIFLILFCLLRGLHLIALIFDIRCYFVYERTNKRFVRNCHKLICTRGIQFIFLEIRLPATNLDLCIIALINSERSIQNPPKCVCRYVHVRDKFDDCLLQLKYSGIFRKSQNSNSSILEERI